MAFATTGILDDFSGTLANFTTFGGCNTLVISAGRVTGTANEYSIMYYDTSQFGPDTEAYITIITKPDSDEHLWIGARIKDVSNYFDFTDGYEIDYVPLTGTDATYVYRKDNGVNTQLGSTISQEFSNGDAIGLEVVGTSNNIKVYRKPSGGSWGQIGTTRSDGTYTTAGYIHLGTYNNIFRGDDFGGGTVAAGGVSILPQMLQHHGG